MKFVKDKGIQEIISKGGIYFVLRIAALILSYFFAVFISRKYGESVYGFVTLAFTIIMIVSSFCRFGFDVTLTKIFAFESDTNYKNVYYKAVLFSGVLSILLSGVIFINAKTIAEIIFKKPEFTIFLQWAAVTIPIWTLLPLNSAIFRGLKKNTLFVFFDSFGRFFITTILFIIFFYFLDGEVEVSTPIIAHFLALLILLAVSFIIVERYFKNINLSNKTSFGRHFVETYPIFFSTTIFIILAWVDKLFLGIFSTEENVAVYDISVRIASLIGFNLEAINSILTPKIAHAYAKKDLLKMQREIKFSVSLSFGLSVITLIGVVLFSDFILGVFGEVFKEGKYVLYIVCIGQLINSFCGSVANLLQMTGNQKLLSRIVFVAMILNIILNVWLIPVHGIIGAAIATSITMAFWNIIGAYFVYKKLGIISIFGFKNTNFET